MKDLIFICTSRYLVTLYDHYTSVIEHYENLRRVDPKMRDICNEAISELNTQKRHMAARIRKQTEHLKKELDGKR